MTDRLSELGYRQCYNPAFQFLQGLALERDSRGMGGH
jgi:hypothetical protein